MTSDEQPAHREIQIILENTENTSALAIRSNENRLIGRVAPLVRYVWLSFCLKLLVSLGGLY